MDNLMPAGSISHTSVYLQVSILPASVLPFASIA